MEAIFKSAHTMGYGIGSGRADIRLCEKELDSSEIGIEH